MKITFTIHYVANQGEILHLVSCNEGTRWPMKSDENGWWQVTIDVKKRFTYRYCCLRQDNVRWEEGESHNMPFFTGFNRLRYIDAWHELNEASCADVLLEKELPHCEGEPEKPKAGEALLRLHASGIGGNQLLAVSGNTGKLGYWRPEDALPMKHGADGLWTARFTLHQGEKIEYKFIVKEAPDGVVKWEYGENRVLKGSLTAQEATVVNDLILNLGL